MLHWVLMILLVMRKMTDWCVIQMDDRGLGALYIPVFVQNAYVLRVIPWLRVVDKKDALLRVPQDMVATAQTWQQVHSRFPVNVSASTDSQTRSFSGLEVILSIPLLSNDQILLSQLHNYGCRGLADLILLDEDDDLTGLDPGRKMQRWAQLDHLSRRNCQNLKEHFGAGFQVDTLGPLARNYLQQVAPSGDMHIASNSTGLSLLYLILRWAEAIVREKGQLFGNVQSLEALAQMRTEMLTERVAEGRLQTLVLRKVSLIFIYFYLCLCTALMLFISIFF